MEHDNDKPRNEPSFGDDGTQQHPAERSDASPLNFEELFAEIDKSVANAKPASAPASSSAEQWVEQLAAASTPEIDDEPLVDAPAQPSLDFGSVVPDAFTPGSSAAVSQPITESSNGEETMSRGVLMAGGALAALGIVLGVAGIFVGASASSKIEALQQSVDALQGKLATIQVSGDPRVGQLQAEQAGIVSRLDEMTARLESETSAAGKGADGRLAELDRRLAALEHKASTSKSAATAPAKTTTGSKTTTTTAKTATVSGGWTVILASYSDKAQSDELRARVQKLGYPAEVLKSLVDGKAVYRVRILGYASHDAAKAAIPGIERKTGISGVWAAQR